LAIAAIRSRRADKKNNRDLSPHKVLLISNSPVGGKQKIHARFLGCLEQRRCSACPSLGIAP